MANTSEFANYVHGQLADLGEVEYGHFFGGVSFKLGDVQFAMCMNNTFYLVVDDKTRPKYVERGSQPFQYQTAKGTRRVQRYYQVPDEVLEDRDALAQWAQDAIAVAMTPKSKSKSKSSSKASSKAKAKAKQPKAK